MKLKFFLLLFSKQTNCVTVISHFKFVAMLIFIFIIVMIKAQINTINKAVQTIEAKKESFQALGNDALKLQLSEEIKKIDLELQKTTKKRVVEDLLTKRSNLVQLYVKL